MKFGLGILLIDLAAGFFLPEDMPMWAKWLILTVFNIGLYLTILGAK